LFLFFTGVYIYICVTVEKNEYVIFFLFFLFQSNHHLWFLSLLWYHFPIPLYTKPTVNEKKRESCKLQCSFYVLPWTSFAGLEWVAFKAHFTSILLRSKCERNSFSFCLTNPVDSSYHIYIYSAYYAIKIMEFLFYVMSAYSTKIVLLWLICNGDIVMLNNYVCQLTNYSRRSCRSLKISVY